MESKTFKHLLAKELSLEELAYVPTSYDVVGDIMIVEIPKEISHLKEKIGKVALTLHKNLKVVANKIGARKGEWREAQLEIIAGEKRFETIHKEAGLKFKVDVQKCYFSPRLVNERLRIARLVKPGEKVLVMFSGVGPYPLVIAKYSKAEKVLGVEANPLAHRFAVENLAMNKLGKKVFLFEGRVEEIVPKLEKDFDRVVMPLPFGAKGYLDLALSAIKEGGTIHYYAFCEGGKEETVSSEIVNRCNYLGRECKVEALVKCGQYAKNVFRFCFDLKVVKAVLK